MKFVAALSVANGSRHFHALEYLSLHIGLSHDRSCCILATNSALSIGLEKNPSGGGT
jgi:hypothetical protein